MLTFEEIQKWSAAEARARLSGPDEDVAHVMQVAAEAGVAEAQARYGQMLLDGKGMATDQAEALRWFSQAAQTGHAMAMNMVGRCCEHGWGTTMDKALAAQWYGAAVKQGLDWAMYNLATLYCLGEGVALDREQALRLYQQAASAGHVKSITMIGGFFEDGWVVERDMTIAADHYRRGAEAGDFRGQFNHARMLIAQDRMDEAMNWLACLPATATPAFLHKVCLWLEAQPQAALHDVARTWRAGCAAP